MGNPPQPQDEPVPPPATAPDVIRLWILLALAFVCVFVAIRVYSPSRNAAGGKAEYSWKVADLDGKPVDLSKYRGRAVFLNVWATWCPPCRREMPSIVRLASDPKLKDVAFLCI